MKTLFKNASILYRKDGKYITLPNAYLGVNEDKISYIGLEKPSEKYDVEKDMSNKLLMAGLINAHGHSPMTLVRGVGSGCNLHEWLFKKIVPLEDMMTPNDTYHGCLLAIAEMLASGTTCFSEMYDFPYASIKAIAETGIKANVCRVGLCFNPDVDLKTDLRTNQCKDIVNGANDFAYPLSERKIELGEEFFSENEKNAISAGKIKVDLSFHSEYLTNEKFVKEMCDFSKGKDICFNIHVSETLKEHEECKENHNGLTPVQYFNSLGALNGHAYLAHCVHISDEDMEIMAKTNTTLVHNPISNLKLGSGIARIKDAIAKGVNVALGTDGVASNNNLDMIEEMHLASLLQSGISGDPAALTVDQVIDMATINGAKALNRNDTGLLEVGYKADIIALDISKPHLIPNNDSASLVVYSANGSDVCMTMVDGKILYEDGKLLTFSIDKASEYVKNWANKNIK